MFRLKVVSIVCFSVFFNNNLSANDALFRMTDSQFDSLLTQGTPVYIKLSDKQFQKFVSTQTENQKTKRQSSTNSSKEPSIFDSINLEAIVTNIPYVLISVLVNKTVLKNVQNPITSSIASFAITSAIMGIASGIINKYKFIFTSVHKFFDGVIRRTNLIFGSRLRTKTVKS